MTDTTVEPSLSVLRSPGTRDVAQDEGGGRQEVKGAHEGRGQEFGPLVASARADIRFGCTHEEAIGSWLEPYNLAEPGGLGRFNPGNVPCLGGPSAGRTSSSCRPKVE